MNRRLILTTTLLLQLSAVMGGEPKKWTLQECIDYAMENNISLKKSKLSAQSAAEDVMQAKAQLAPSLSASTTQSLGYKPWIDAGTGTVTNGTVNNSVNKSYYNGSYGINANWTVWNGNKNRNTLKVNRISERQALLSASETANSIQEEITKLYVQILFQTEAVKVCRESKENSKKNEERGREMLEVGKISKADLAQLTAQTAQDEYAEVEAESNLAKYNLQLKQLLELNTTDEFAVSTAPASANITLDGIPKLMPTYEAALLNRPEIENGKLAIESGKLNEAIAKAGRMPTLSLSAGVGTSTSSMNSKQWGTQIKTNFDTSLGLSVSVPLFDNRQTRTAVNKARIQNEQYILDLQDKQKQLYSTIEGYWLDATTNQQKLVAAKANVESAQAGYDLLSEQFRLGLKNITELLDGKTNLLTAKQNMLESKYLTIMDIELLNFYAGKGITGL